MAAWLTSSSSRVAAPSPAFSSTAPRYVRCTGDGEARQHEPGRWRDQRERGRAATGRRGRRAGGAGRGRSRPRPRGAATQDGGAHRRGRDERDARSGLAPAESRGRDDGRHDYRSPAVVTIAGVCRGDGVRRARGATGAPEGGQHDGPAAARAAPLSGAGAGCRWLERCRGIEGGRRRAAAGVCRASGRGRAPARGRRARRGRA